MAATFQNVKPNGEWTNDKTHGETMEAARNQCEAGLKIYALFKNGKKIRKGLRKWVLAGLNNNLKNSKVGDSFSVNGPDGQLFRCREIVPAIRVIDLNGNDKADRAWSVAKAKYSDIGFLGAYVCKSIAGSGSPSQHSYGNAVDFGRNSMAQLYDLAHYLLSQEENEGKLDLQHVIVDDRIWTRGYGWSYYGGQRHYHVHVDFTPQYSGSCGVRG